MIFLVVCFFFKQKTAYEMRISDWSSDVCSSDLQDGDHPVGRPGALRRLVDAGERLQGDRRGCTVCEFAAEVVPIATHGERRRADRPAEVEGEDLGPLVAPELQGHQRKQHRLAKSEEHTSELQSLLRISYAVFCMK